jgi:hypothetical protein
MWQSYKYFEMSHLEKTRVRAINQRPRKTKKEKMALWYFRNNY